MINPNTFPRMTFQQWQQEFNSMSLEGLQNWIIYHRHNDDNLTIAIAYNKAWTQQGLAEYCLAYVSSVWTEYIVR